MNGLQVDWQIRRLVKQHGMLDPFVAEQVRTQAPRDLVCWSQARGYWTEPANERVLSYGLSSAGYDIRAARQFKVLRDPRLEQVRRSVPHKLIGESWEEMRERFDLSAEFGIIKDDLGIDADQVKRPPELANIFDASRSANIWLIPGPAGDYDVRVERLHAPALDCKAHDPSFWIDVECDVLELPPGGFALGVSVERFAIPSHICATFLPKSTAVRSAWGALMSPAEPGWSGHLTLEFTNYSTAFGNRIYAGEGCAQALFWRIAEPAAPYGDRPNRYQNQGAAPTPGEV